MLKYTVSKHVALGSEAFPVHLELLQLYYHMTPQDSDPFAKFRENKFFVNKSMKRQFAECAALYEFKFSIILLTSISFT